MIKFVIELSPEIIDFKKKRVFLKESFEKRSIQKEIPQKIIF